MSRLLRLAMATILLLSAPVVRAHAADPPSPTLEDGRHYVLVLLKLPAQHLHPNGGYSDSYGDGAYRNERLKFVTRLARQYHLSLVEDWAMPLVGVDCYVLAVPADQSAEKLADALTHEPGVAWSEPMNAFHALGGTDPRSAAAPDDPLFRAQPSNQEWRLSDLHQLSTGRAVHVAVVDSMVEATHPDLLGQVDDAADFVTAHPTRAEHHGTAVAGVIAARSGNHLGIVGVAPGSRLMALRACWQQAGAGVTVCDSLALAKAINYAIEHKAQVINLSLSGPTDPLLARLLDVAMTRGVTVVGAYDRNVPGGGFPANHAGVIAVVDSRPSGASLGANSAAMAAPGRDIPTTQVDGHWNFVSGSSYSAAHVSGLVALVKELSPRANASSALVLVRPGGDIDVCATLLRVSGPGDSACAHKRTTAAVIR